LGFIESQRKYRYLVNRKHGHGAHCCGKWALLQPPRLRLFWRWQNQQRPSDQLRKTKRHGPQRRGILVGSKFGVYALNNVGKDCQQKNENTGSVLMPEDENKPESDFTINRPIAIPLNGFEFRHTSDPSEDPEQDHLFVGRKKIIGKLVSLFENSKRKRGSYLVAGYRGVGKTSVVKKAIKKFVDTSSCRSPLVVDINLGDESSLKPSNIYFSMANILRDKIKSGGVKKGIMKNGLRIFFQPVVSVPRVLFLTFFFLCIIGIMKQASFVEDFFSEYLFYFLLLPALFWIISSLFFPAFKILKDIDDLIEAMSYEVSEDKNTGINHSLFNFGFSKNKKRQPIHSREAEERLSRILEHLSKYNYQVIFILDEIDKLSDYEEHAGIGDNETEKNKNKTINIDSMLGSLKNYFTTAKATFIFISGRETLDRYYSEKGSPNSLYGSLFDQVFEIPSFLTDEGEQFRGTQLTHLIEEYVCRCLRRESGKSDDKSNKDYYTLGSYYTFLQGPENKKEAHRLISILRVFIHYLTFHSWGNPKRLSSIFESFVVPQSHLEDELREKSFEELGGNKADHWLVIDASHHHRFALASDMITLFQHQVNREISRISDKLTVSTLASLHFILKFHSYGFTRESLHRMSEALNVHRSPELNTIIDDLLTHVLKSYIRRIRNGAYRYRFNSSFEQELRHISQYSDLESASHNFSLDSMKHVKRVFENIIANKSEDVRVIAGAHVTLGDICAIEQSYNNASVHYRTASNMFAVQMLEENKFMQQEILMQYTDAMIKQGDLEERRQNYNYAAAIYSDAEQGVKSVLKQDDAKALCQSLQDGDSKLDTLKQPFWASQFLSLKRSPRGKTTISRPNYLYNKNDSRYHLRAANLSFFLNNVEDSAKSYRKTLDCLGQSQNTSHPNERSAYLRGNAKVGLAEATLINQSNQFFKVQLSETASPQKIVFFKKLLTFSNKPIAMGMCLSPRIDNLMKEAAECFETNQLYISAAITYIKIICYYSQILDIFDPGLASERLGNNDQTQLKYLVEKTNSYTEIFGKKALECINKARQLETTQGCKTLLIRDLNKFDNFDMKATQLFDVFFGDVTDKDNKEMGFWQHSIWAHKLAASLLWADFVVRKAAVAQGPSKLSYMPHDLSLLSARSSITVRWIRARELSHKHIYKKLFKKDGKEICAFSILDNYKNNMQNVELLDDCIMAKPEQEYNDILKNAYSISRDLYFALRSIRFTSRKNIDLVFPSMTQIYYIQWKLLSNLLIAILVKDKLGDNKITSIRDLSFLLQKALVNIDEKEAPHERIPASHFDYEYIFMFLNTSLKDSINLVDKTSRTRTNILQNKYYCHDDHSDPEFRMDYTLAYMFIPSAQYLSKHVNNIHEKLAAAVKYEP